MPHSRRHLLVIGAAAAVVIAACGGGGSDGGYDVSSQAVSDATTQSISLFEPDAEGSWPVVLAFHGFNGSAEQMAPLAERLAAAGAVVFAPNYRTDLSSEQGVVDLVRDAECGYRYARTVAPDHGGDLDRPLIWVGWSLGAVFAVQAGLEESLDPTGQFLSCFAEAPRPDIIFAISGCYYEVGQPFDPEKWGNPEAQITVIAGQDDTVCPASQSEQATEELAARGYDVDFVMLEGADHFAPVLHHSVNEEMVVAPDEPAGNEVLQLITAALDGS
jgi:dienelactone hydrolase